MALGIQRGCRQDVVLTGVRGIGHQVRHAGIEELLELGTTGNLTGTASWLSTMPTGLGSTNPAIASCRSVRVGHSGAFVIDREAIVVDILAVVQVCDQRVQPFTRLRRRSQWKGFQHA